MLLYLSEKKPAQEVSEETITEKVTRIGLGSTSTIVLFGCGTLLLLVTVLVQDVYLYISVYGNTS